MKTAVVTGANSGIGRVTAEALANAGWRVLLVCRNRQKGETALHEISAATANPQLQLFVADLSVMQEIRRVAEEVKAAAPSLDVLVNNAGAINMQREVTADGYERTFATNHLGFFYLTELLLDRLLAAPAARIINIASQAQWGGRIHWDDVHLAKGYSGIKAYMQSKLMNLMFTKELAQRLSGKHVTVNAVHPGPVASGFGKNDRGWFATAVKLVGGFMRTPARGADTVIWLATAPQVEGVTGKYFHDRKEIRARRITDDPAARERLWKLSAELAHR